MQFIQEENSIMLKSIHVTGLGGQGILTFSKLLANYVTGQGYKVSLFHAKGMAQRGGRVTSEIRISSDRQQEFGPRIARDAADIVVGLEIGEAINSFSFLKQGGMALIHDYASVPSRMILEKDPYPSAQQARDVYKRKTDQVFIIEQVSGMTNIYFLGLFCSLTANLDDFPTLEANGLEETIKKRLSRAIEANLDAFRRGYEYGTSVTVSV
jgi:indolepyruvate ferredoxin oxidoreductase beta subunit